MARHRSPRGRRAHRTSPLAALRHATANTGAHRSVPTPLRRGAAVVAVTGGAFSLVGATAPPPAVPAAQPVAVVPVAAVPVVPVAVVPAEAGPQVRLLPAVEPVAPDPEVIDAADLVKAVALAEQEIARLAAEQQAAQDEAAKDEAARAKAAERDAVSETVSASTGSAGCGLSTSGLGAVKSHVRDAAEFLGCLFGEPTMHGVAGRAGTSDHPSGRAIDFMVDRSTGDALAACALRNKEALGITYVIWRQRINNGSGWESMEDRGGVTANHYDHVHISFGSGAGGPPRGC